MKGYKCLIVILFLTLFHWGAAQDIEFKWPEGTTSAVCLTYDDAINTHLDIAIPDLNKEDLRGTFYMQGSNISIERMEDWREASRQGHELGNHTVYHPCTINYDWIDEEFSTEKYSVSRMLLELKVMNTLLYALDGQEERSFSYACSETEVSGISYIDSLRKSGLFVGARGGGQGVVDDMKSMNIFNVPSWGVLEPSGQEMIDFVKGAENVNGLAVFMFHGVGGDYLKVSRKAHTELLSYLNKNRKTIWVAPFVEIIQHIISERERLGWEN
ncbi:polysaccharide deacetylase family protein [Bacteroidota bacterium]